MSTHHSASSLSREAREVTFEILHQTLESGVMLRVEGDALRWKSARGVLSDEQREALRAHKSALLQVLEPDVNYLPLLPSQKRIWLQCRASPQSAMYLMPAVVHIEGALNIEAFALALAHVRERFDAWRTTFPVLGGAPVQAVVPPQPRAEYSPRGALLPLTDLCALPEAARLAQAETLAAEFSRRAFELESEIGNRFALLRMSRDEHWLLMNMHHIHSDRWSLRLIWREWGRAYNRLIAGEADTASESEDGARGGSWAEYVMWRQAWLQSEKCRRELEYWRPRLQRALRLPDEIAPDFSRPPLTSPRSGALDVHLTAAHVEALKELAQRVDPRATLHTALIATLALALRDVRQPRNAQQESEQGAEIRIGSATASRGQSAARRAVGLLANTVTLLLAPRASDGFSQWLSAAQQEIDAAHAHQDTPLETLLERIAPEAEYSGASPATPFQVFFVMQNISMQRWNLRDLKIFLRQTDDLDDDAKFDLTISAYDDELNSSGALRLAFIYNAEIFRRETIEAFAAHYEALLHAVCSDASATIADLPRPPVALFTRETAPRDGVLWPPAHIAASSDVDAPFDETETALAEIWQRLLRVERVWRDDNFFDLGGHSMLAVRLLDEVESRFKAQLPLANFFQAPTLGGQAELLRALPPSAFSHNGNAPAPRDAAAAEAEKRETETAPGTPLPSASLVALRSGDKLPPLFCIDGAVRYRALAQYLSDEQPVYGLIPEAPTEGQWFSFTKIDERVAHYVSEIRRVQPHGPYFLAGLSFGGLVAFWVAQSLRAQGERIALLSLFDTYGPGYLTMSWRRRLSWHWKAWTSLEAEERAKYIGKRVGARLKRLASVSETAAPPDAQAIAAGEEDDWQIDILNRPLSDGEKTALRGLVRQARKHPELWQYPDRLLIFSALDKPREFLSVDPMLGWSEFAPRIETYLVPGDHVGILREPNVRVLAARLQAALHEAREETQTAQS